MYVMVNFDRLYDPLSEIKIDRAELEVFDPKVWDSQGSGKQIPEEAASSVERVWLERTGGVSIPYADEIPVDSQVREGASKQVVVNAYERNPEARERCIRKWGLNCSVCSFHFELFYGQLGKGYIHVHHLKPLSEIREEYEINPEEDLRPVCPNCHSMLHRNKPALSIEELQKLVRTYGSRVHS
jgi:5-methylcytosine-specific restriction protein A